MSSPSSSGSVCLEVADLTELHSGPSPLNACSSPLLPQEGHLLPPPSPVTSLTSSLVAPFGRKVRRRVAFLIEGSDGVTIQRYQEDSTPTIQESEKSSKGDEQPSSSWSRGEELESLRELAQIRGPDVARVASDLGREVTHVDSGVVRHNGHLRDQHKNLPTEPPAPPKCGSLPSQISPPQHAVPPTARGSPQRPVGIAAQRGNVVAVPPISSPRTVSSPRCGVPSTSGAWGTFNSRRSSLSTGLSMTTAGSPMFLEVIEAGNHSTAHPASSTGALDAAVRSFDSTGAPLTPLNFLSGSNNSSPANARFARPRHLPPISEGLWQIPAPEEYSDSASFTESSIAPMLLPAQEGLAPISQMASEEPGIFSQPPSDHHLLSPEEVPRFLSHPSRLESPPEEAVGFPAPSPRTSFSVRAEQSTSSNLLIHPLVSSFTGFQNASSSFSAFAGGPALAITPQPPSASPNVMSSSNTSYPGVPPFPRNFGDSTNEWWRDVSSSNSSVVGPHRGSLSTNLFASRPNPLQVNVPEPPENSSIRSSTTIR